DPYFADGAELRLEQRGWRPWRPTLELTVEEHGRPAYLAVDEAPLAGNEAPRPVRGVPEGRLLSLRAALRREPPGGSGLAWWGHVSTEGARFAAAPFLATSISGGVRAEDHARRRSLRAEGLLAAVTGDPPPQALLYIGGRGSLPGWPYRGFAGDRLGLVRAEADAEVAGPWVRLRALGAAGWTALRETAPPEGWDVAPTAGVRASVGLGVGLVHDVLRIDRMLGLGDGHWETVVTVSPRLTDLL
ncbi:MAG TPA: hypothetical protein VMK65_07840, partial [Longimicrobiales bacterium]|nr:hypothetical protein [Longimicrobiales bacterium]